MYDDESVLFQLVERGLINFPSSDDVAIGSIVRYTAVMGEHLWSLLEHQQAMIDQVERRFYKAMSDNHVLSEKIIRLETRLDRMSANYSPVVDDQGPPSVIECFNSLVGSLINTVAELRGTSSRVDVCTERPKSGAVSMIADPVVPRSAWVGLFVDVPLVSIEGRKCRQRERLQRAQEVKASKHSETPPVDAILETIKVIPSEVSLYLQR
ncbi:hypothetical protein BDM02DRAFT_3194008 [Thelephora ganbajun]|uniref:Uncharacterized protein n=1 Tax=Thelephora ganbajun TaxID=370292 RepID=A0ACB6YX77_THEGA|nr:hypothetical protein BDM02DRAFT_3194008 [Thelephora ganbajun]